MSDGGVERAPGFGQRLTCDKAVFANDAAADVWPKDLLRMGRARRLFSSRGMGQEEGNYAPTMRTFGETTSTEKSMTYRTHFAQNIQGVS